MLGKIRRLIPSDESGAALVLVAISMVALLAAASLAVDLGMAMTARSEAQRVADSAALAGASAFIDEPSAMLAVDSAKSRAKAFAAKNVVRNAPVDTTTVASSTLIDETVDMTVEVIPTEQKVRVWVRQQGVGTWFARILGVRTLGIQAMAAAVASDGGTAECLMPFWGVDMWDDNDNDTNWDNIPDEGEAWEYDPLVDNYQQATLSRTGTGFGSDHRGDYVYDMGRPIVIKAGSVGTTKTDNPGGLETMVAPGNFLLWRLPDPDKNCQEEGSGGSFLLENMLRCNECDIRVVQGVYSAEPEPGQTWGKVREGMDSLMARDPYAEWASDDSGVIDGRTGASISQSPRIVAVALADPNQPGLLSGASQDIQFNNFARVFLEGYNNADKVIYARFIGFTYGGEGEPTGSLIKYLRLVE